jgi:serine-type D-Ala-D-Ala carboxypeptidase/endopeptidase (penicillin-binding protein 4)
MTVRRSRALGGALPTGWGAGRGPHSSQRRPPTIALCVALAGVWLAAGPIPGIVGAPGAAPAGALTVDGGSDALGATAGSTTALFAEGTTREGFQEYLTLLNPATGPVVATVTWDLVDTVSGGRSRSLLTQTIPPGRTTIDVNRALQGSFDVGATVSASGPLVVERPMYFAATLTGSGFVTGGSTILGPSSANTSAAFAEGSTRDGFQEYLSVANPSSASITATLTWDLVDAATTQRSHRVDPVVLRPGRTTVDVNATVGAERDVSVSVAAGGPIVAERPTYFTRAFSSAGVVDGGTDAAGSTSTSTVAAFAEGTTRAGFQDYVTVLNPQAHPVAALLAFDLVDGTDGARQHREMSPMLPPGRTTVDVNSLVGPDQDVSLVIRADGPILAERPLYFHSLVGAAGEVSGASSVPGGAASSSFLFAEGTTRPGFQEYLTLLNPTLRTITATITWDAQDPSGGRSHLASGMLLRSGRSTIDVDAVLGGGLDVSARVDAGDAILAERPEYFRLDLPSGAGLRAAVAAALSDSRFAGSTVGVSIWVEGVGEVAGQDADAGLLPASTEKIFTAAGLLEGIGTGATLTTQLLVTAPPSGGVVRGNLVLVGGGDPLLASRGPISFDGLAAALVSRGIVHVTGSLVGDETRYDSARTAPGWKPTYLPDGDVGPLSALAVDENTGHETDPAYLSNPVPGDLETLRSVLSAHGVAVDGPDAVGAAPPGAILAASATSPAVGDLVREMLTDSDNFTAELLTKELGRRAQGAGTTASGTAAIAAALGAAGLPDQGSGVDGSGLSLLDQRSASTERRLLQAVETRPWFSTLLSGLPLAGRTGTLADRFIGTPAESNLRAKTGTLSGVRALSGYLSTSGGRGVVFSIIVNGASPTAVGAIDSMMVAIASDRS